MDDPIVSVPRLRTDRTSEASLRGLRLRAGGAGDEWTVGENVRAFDRWVIRPRVLVGVAARDTSTEVLGSRVSLPVLVAPWAFQNMAHPEGDVPAARGAARAGTIMVLSATASHRLDDVAKATDAPKWFRLYVYRDRDFSKDVLRHAYELGFAAVVFTLDVPVLSKRDRDRRNQLDCPAAEPSARSAEASFAGPSKDLVGDLTRDSRREGISG